jgi:3-oxoacyl-[acyl-carrier-protein] synthase I
VSLRPIAVLSTGLVTAAGLSAPATAAAIRAGVGNPTETRFVDSAGKRLMAHQVTLEHPWRGRSKLVQMASLAIVECLADIPRDDWSNIPLLLCVAERDRPGRVAGLDDELFVELQSALGVQFAAQSLIIPQGRASAWLAMMHARRMLGEGSAPHVLVAATDSLINRPALAAPERAGRLLTSTNSNGFIAGEGSGALLFGAADAELRLTCAGLGFGTEPATVSSEEPLRADGLARAITEALREAEREIQDLHFRITDLSGEQYYFKEAALALARLLRVRKDEFDLWHPAQCVGELGSVAGVTMLVVAEAACRKGYAPGPDVLCHCACDAGQRAAAVMRFGAAQ